MPEEEEEEEVKRFTALSVRTNQNFILSIVPEEEEEVKRFTTLNVRTNQNFILSIVLDYQLSFSCGTWYDTT